MLNTYAETLFLVQTRCHYDWQTRDSKSRDTTANNRTGMAFQKQAHTQWPLNEDHHVDTAGTTDQQHGPAAPEQSGGHRVLSKVAQNIHYFTFLPLIIISVLSDISLVLAASICTGLVVCIILLSFVCYRAGIVKVSVCAAAEVVHGQLLVPHVTDRPAPGLCSCRQCGSLLLLLFTPARPPCRCFPSPLTFSTWRCMAA